MSAADRSRARRRPLPAIVLGAVALAGAAAWLLLRHDDIPGGVAAARETVPPTPADVAAATLVAPTRAPAPQPAEQEAPPPVPPGPAGESPPAPLAHAPGEQPHPITPAHERIFRENQLIGQLNGALDVKDAQGLRRLLGEYRAQYPDDPNQLQGGYAIIADCLDHPGALSKAAGQRYYDVERGSILRRMVDRFCLEP